MLTADFFTAVFEDLPIPAMIFEPNEPGFKFITCNHQYELLSPVYRFSPCNDTLKEVATRMENIKPPAAWHAGTCWQPEYQPVITEGKLTAITCLWHLVNERPPLDSDYIGIVSHELKTPLTVINACIQVAAARSKNQHDKVMDDAFEKSGRQVKKMLSIINGFLDVARLEAGPLHLERKKFCLGELVKETVRENHLLLQGHKIRLIVPGNIFVFADREKINSVITNLLSNAVKYSPPGSLIEILCRRSGELALLSIRDEGIGIPEEQLARVFDRYYRADHLNVSGYGIGLYLSSEIIRQHEGFLSAKSEPGKGSVFQFCLASSVRQMDTAC